MNKTLLGVTAVATFTGIAVGAGQVMARYGRRGEETDDEFRRVVVMNGQEVTITAREFRGGDVLLGLGGAQVDLSEATLAPEGATLRVRGAMGGVNVIVPDTWRVTGDLHGLGGLNLDTTPADDLPDSEPGLHLDVVAVLAGVNVQGVNRSSVIDLRPQPAEAGTAD